MQSGFIDLAPKPGFRQRVRRRLVGGDAGRVLSLALPAVGEQLLNLMVGLTNTYMVGHLGAAAVASVGLANQAVMLVTTFFMATATGVTALVARHVGAEEHGAASTTVHQGYILGAGLGLGATLLGLTLAVPALHALGAPADVIIPGSQYLRIVSSTLVLAAWMFIGNAALRGAGDTRTTMMVMAVVNVVNVTVAYVCIYGMGPIPPLGVAGSAVGAAVGRGTGGLLVLSLLWRGRRGLRLRLHGMVPNGRQLMRILNIGLPAGAEQAASRVAQTILAVTVAGLGTAAYAAHQLALQAESISLNPAMGFSVAATTLTGQGLGAGRPDRARSDALLSYKLALLVMSAMGVIFFFFPGWFIDLFIDDPSVVALGIWPVRAMAIFQPALAGMTIMSGSLRGAGDTRTTLLISVCGMWVVRVPLVLLLARFYGLNGVWMAIVLDIYVRAGLVYLRFRTGGWARLRV